GWMRDAGNQATVVKAAHVVGGPIVPRGVVPAINVVVGVLRSGVEGCPVPDLHEQLLTPVAPLVLAHGGEAVIAPLSEILLVRNHQPAGVIAIADRSLVQPAALVEVFSG